MKTKQIALAVVVALAAGAASADIKIASIQPLTGGSSALGVSSDTSARIAVEEVNSLGGVKLKDGSVHKLILTSYDDMSDPKNGPLLAQKAIADGNLIGIGHANYGVAKAAIPIWQQERHVFIVPTSAGGHLSEEFEKEPYNAIFRTTANDGLQTTVVADYLAKNLKGGTACTATDTTAYGEFGKTEVTAKLAARGIKVAEAVKYNVKDTDFTAQALKLKNCSVVAIWAIAPEAKGMTEALRRAGFQGLISAGWGAVGPVWFTNPAVEGSTVPLSFIQTAATTPKQKAYLAAWKAKTGTDTIPLAAAGAQNYDTIMIIAQALRETPSLKFEDLVRTLENLKGSVQGVVKTYNKPFSAAPGGHEALRVEDVQLGVVRNGQIYPTNK